MPTTLEQVERDHQRFLAVRIFEAVGNGQDPVPLLEDYRRSVIDRVLLAVGNVGILGSQDEHRAAVQIAERLRVKLLDDDDR